MTGSSHLWGPATLSCAQLSEHAISTPQSYKVGKILIALFTDGETEALRGSCTAWQHVWLSSLRVFWLKEIQKGIRGHWDRRGLRVRGKAL